MKIANLLNLTRELRLQYFEPPSKNNSVGTFELHKSMGFNFIKPKCEEEEENQLSATASGVKEINLF